MRARVIEAFGDAAAAAAAARLGRPVLRGAPVRGAPSRAVAGVAALAGLSGDLQGRLLMDLDATAASALGGSSRQGQLGMAELAEEVIARALAILRSAGTRIEATPPLVLTGQNLEVTTSHMETMAVPIGIPEGTLVVSIAALEGGD